MPNHLRRVMAAVVFAVAAMGQQPNFKDRPEYDLYNSILQSQNDASKQLQLLSTWKEKYPDSEFKLVRADLFAKDYLTLNQPAQAVKASQEALAIDPKDATALLTILRAAPYVQPSTSELQKAGEDAATAVIEKWGSLKPERVSEADWSKAKTEIEPLAQFVLGWVKVTQKDYASAEKPLKCALATSGNAMVQYGLASYWLGTALYSQKKIPEGLYEIAHAITYNGPGALDAAMRGKAETFLNNAYQGYHGDQSGLNELKELAAKTALPPEGFSIKSVEQIASEQQTAQSDFDHQHPDVALWRLLRTTLQGDSGPTYFEQNMKGAQIPPQNGEFKVFKAKVVSQPSPKELLVNVDNGVGDATLVFAAPIRGRIDSGAEIEFSGVVESYTKDPFNVRFTVDRKDVKGLPGSVGGTGAVRR